MKVVIGHKVLNLEELYTVGYLHQSETAPVEVVVDSQIYAELSKQPPKEQPADYPKDAVVNLKREEARAVLLVKVI